MTEEYHREDEGIEAEGCECALPRVSPVAIEQPFYFRPAHHFSIVTSTGRSAVLEVPRDITLADWNEVNRILQVLKPRQKRERRRKKEA